MNVLTYVDLDANILNQCTSIASSIQQLSMSFGIVCSAICLSFFLRYYPLESFSSLAFSHSFFVIGFATLLTAFIFCYLNKMDGACASGMRVT